MTSTYRRDHASKAFNDEFLMLTAPARANIVSAVTTFEALYPLPVASSSEKTALNRAFARFLIDSGKASLAGILA
jgi:hypothetical protein